jgi:hypothetical protein
MIHSIVITQDLKGLLVKCSCGCKIIENKTEIPLPELSDKTISHVVKAKRGEMKGG